MARSSKTSLHVIDRPCIKKQKHKSRPIFLLLSGSSLKINCEADDVLIPNVSLSGCLYGYK